MIELPDKKSSFEYENGFYLTCESSRIGKLLAHYELYKLVKNIKGSFVECGVYKGASLARFVMFRELFNQIKEREIIAFDTFDTFPETDFDGDLDMRKNFINESGEESISKDQLQLVLEEKQCDVNVELIEGDICKTVPDYVRNHPELKIALLNLDVDIYEPSVSVLKNFYPHIVEGGVLILDDYGTFPGETKAVDDFFENQNVDIKKFSFSNTPRYIIK
tara:strand:+ start:179 stop:838 length:660 start_codon:yes stop_codon:yes gene_type:complete